MASISRRGVTDGTQRKFNRKDFYGSSAQRLIHSFMIQSGPKREKKIAGYRSVYTATDVEESTAHNSMIQAFRARSQTSNGAFVTTLDPRRAPTCTPCLYRATNCLRNENIVPVNK
ncbi:hypothetical protein ALC57_01811 [Trachymyrmex cornetzi]|uniref:Uncharacterized protein n=1 Tax=Trachymyrmex cornetzi TaxID=471704 RepID=A0A195EKT5_9HYME|nr:hypothetical protein ALC57_01811 [Trachymyrmex cornetzi]